MKLIVGSFLSGLIFGIDGFNFPAAALPSFGFILAVYGALILWELRVLLPEVPRLTMSKNVPLARSKAGSYAAPRRQARSSTA